MSPQARLQAGLQAPSGRNMQTTTFVIVDDPDLVRQIGALHGSNTAVQQARAFIACMVDEQPAAVYEGHSFQVEDCAAAVENMLLAIHALGLGGVWILSFSKEAVRETLGIPKDWKIVSLVPFGYYDPDGVSEYKGRKLPNTMVRLRRPLGDVAFLNSPDEPLEE